MGKATKSSVALAMMVVLAGCASGGMKKTKTVQAVFDESDPAVLELNESALRVARASEQAALAMSVGGKGRQNTATTQEFKIDLNRLPRELREPILLERGFHGELEPFVRSVADVVAWSVMVVGNKPTVPVLVSLAGQRRAPAEWLADAGYQAGGEADVVVNPSARQFLIKYKR